MLNITIYKMGVHWLQRLDPAWKGYHSWARQPQAWLLANRKYDQRYLMEKGVCQAGPVSSASALPLPSLSSWLLTD